MVLVGYSDSEGSDEERETLDARFQRLPRSDRKSSFRKINDGTQSSKIRVSLAALGSERTSDSPQDHERPNKRIRTEGIANRFSARLPPPRKTGHKKNADSLAMTVDAARSDRGINLVTSTAPSLARSSKGNEIEAQEDASRASFPSAESTPGGGPGDPVPLASKTVSANMKMFKPLSVSRKGSSKPATSTAAPLRSAPGQKEDLPRRSLQSSEPSINRTVSNTKSSLFSSGAEDQIHEDDRGRTSSHETYRPLLYDSNAEERGIPAASHETESVGVTRRPATEPQGGPQDLRELADTLHLSAADRRQLLGREGLGHSAAVAHFSLAAEYSHNRKAAEEQRDLPAHNPVRAVAPGKHSLTQLMQNAASQHDALEEAFASGRKNKQEAGNRYGW